MKRRTSPGTDSFFVWALLLGDLSVAAWLWFSFWRFRGETNPDLIRVLVPAAISSVLAAALGLHPRPEGRGLRLLGRLTGLGVAVAALARLAEAVKWLSASAKEAAWLGAATAIILWLLRAFYWRQTGSPAGRAGELIRWIAVGVSATLAMLPFYFAGSVGAGDAHWYTVMISDFLAQLKAGAFPIWVGQSPFAFNGAVSPIRYAPAFQYYSGVVDFLTAQALQPVAVKNLCLALSAIGGAFAAYGCLRPVVYGRRWIACLLAILWIWGPGVLAPVMSGDQYMTFIALPFVPIVLHGCWRVLVHDDLWGRLWIAAGLAGLWLCHPPVGLWMTVIAAAIYISAMLFRRAWARELKCVAFMAAVFLAMGSFPFVSLLNLDNQLRVASVGLSAAFEVHKYFPGNFRPIDPAGGGLLDYQIGYALLGTLAVSLLLAAYSRSKAAWSFAAASVLIIPFAVPVPFLTDAAWAHLPGWFVTINNVWPMQRLFLVWSALAAFTGGIVFGSARISGPAWRYALLIAMLTGGLLWSAGEARKLAVRITRSRSSAERTRILEGPNNTDLGRYPYAAFETTPGYASHGFMDAWFENRLLDRKTREPFLTNADGAAPGDNSAPGGSTLISKGLMTAENITDSTSYFLKPTLTLEPGRRYALRLELFDQRTEGWLQITQDTMFREYILPDSGAGIGRSGPPRAFGAGATSGKVISLSILGNEPAALTAILITPRPTHKNFAAGRYWLYTYERSRLPIAVESWVPYRVRFTAPRSAFLESPRMWLKDWHASVNGIPVPVERSPEGLVMVPVQAGPNVVTLEYVPPFAVRASFCCLLFSWLAAGAASLAWLIGVTPPRPANALAHCLPIRRRIFILAAVVAAAAAAAYLTGKTWGGHGYSGAAGPIEAGFLLPHGKAGMSDPLLGTGHPPAGFAEDFGPVHMIVTLPSAMTGRREPILTTGRNGAGDVIYVFYEDTKHIRIGFDHWSVGGQLSAPIAVDYAEPHEIWILEGALFPELGDEARWGATTPDTRKLLKSKVAVVLDGETVIDESSSTYPSTRKEITPAKNKIGASTADPVFSGALLYSERTGTFIPPGFKL